MECLSQDERKKLRATLHKCVAEHDVDDVLQSMELEIWRKKAPLEVAPGDTVQQARGRLLWGMLRRQVSQHRKQAARCPGDLVDPAELEDAAFVASAEDGVIDREAWTAVEAALRQTEPRIVACLEAHYLDEQTAPCIARELHVPTGTVYTWLRAGRLGVQEIVSRADLLERTAGQLARVRWCAEAEKENSHV